MDIKLVSQVKLFETLKKLNIHTGDIVFLSSDKLNQDHISQNLYLIESLINYLGSEGSLIMDLSGSNFNVIAKASQNKLLANQALRDLMPGFSKDTLAFYAKDDLAKTLLLKKDVVISNSHSYPYLGFGKYAQLICQSQSLDFPNGFMSPLSRLYELRAKALMINTDLSDFAINRYVFETSFNSSIIVNGGAISKNQKISWKKFLEKPVDKNKIKKVY